MLGPCFTAPAADPATCRHPPQYILAWTIEEGPRTILVSVCCACDTVLPDKVLPKVKPLKPTKDT